MFLDAHDDRLKNSYQNKKLFRILCTQKKGLIRLFTTPGENLEYLFIIYYRFTLTITADRADTDPKQVNPVV